MKNRHAFTMIELVFIIVILGILGAIAVPKMAANREDALYVGYRADLKIIENALRTHYIATGKGATNLGELPLELNQERWSMDRNRPLKDQTMFRTKQNGTSGSTVTCTEVDLNQGNTQLGKRYVFGFPPAGESRLCDRLYEDYAKQGLTVKLWQNKRYFEFDYIDLVKSVQP